MVYSKSSRASDQLETNGANLQKGAAQFVDNRASSTAQLRLQGLMNASPQATAQRKQQDSMQSLTAQPIALQRVENEELLQGKFAIAQCMEDEELLQGKFATTQLMEDEELLQGKFETAQRVEDEELLQGKFETAQLMEEDELQAKFVTAQRMEEEEPLQGKFEALQRMEDEELLQGKFAVDLAPQVTAQLAEQPNNTGLPNQLKAGIESLSGMSMDHVKVHYNSDKPAQLNAHAYAQGSDIHVAAGQEQHLPHEAWHVVQQAQGRVKPTMQMKAGVPVNDDVGLETEADVMGAKALQLKVNSSSGFQSLIENHTVHPVAQREAVIQMYDSVPAVKVKSVISTLHGDWIKGSDERTMTVWQIAEDANWDFHFTAMYDSTGINMTKFHFTIRHKVGAKGDDAFAWFEIAGHDKNASLGARGDAGKVAYWDSNSTDFANVDATISAEFANINTWAAGILTTTVSYIK